MANSERSIPVAKPWMDEQEVEAIRRTILSGWVTQGPEVAAFEREFAAYVGGKHACAVSSCTTGLHLALLVVGVKPGDEVITVSHSFIATANSIRFCGATPIFVDIQPRTFNMDPNLVERAITDRTRAILCVHQIGMPCDLRSILDIAKRYSLPVVEDCACAMGSEILWENEWEKIGKPQADVTSFSFHPRKVVTTGDGGMITTSNPEWDEHFRLWRHHGMSIQTTVRHQSKEVLFESYPEVAYNYRMTDIQAAMGRVQLKRLPEMIERRRYMAARYCELLSTIPDLVLPEEPKWARSNWQSYSVRLPDRCDQRATMQFLLDRGVATRRGVMCSHREEAYVNTPCPWPLIESEKAQDHCIILPLFHQMIEEDQDYVVDMLSQACRLSGK
jgi:perosamine synthetase